MLCNELYVEQAGGPELQGTALSMPIYRGSKFVMVMNTYIHGKTDKQEK